MLMQEPFQWPAVAIAAIRQSYPRKKEKKRELVAIEKALDRLVQGERGEAMVPADAVAFLRRRVANAKHSFAGREQKHIPHLTTFLNQSRYLTTTKEQPPPNLADAISILSCYPTVTEVDVDAWMPVLRVIDAHVEFYKATHGTAAASFLRTRAMRYAELVARWPDTEKQFIPGPMKWFTERRYEQSESLWQRTPANGFQSERDQLSRII